MKEFTGHVYSLFPILIIYGRLSNNCDLDVGPGAPKLWDEPFRFEKCGIEGV
jgi:hypothetical protein